MPGCFIDQRERNNEELKSKSRRRRRCSGQVSLDGLQSRKTFPREWPALEGVCQSLLFTACYRSVLQLGQLFVTPWTLACQASLSITNYQSLLTLMSIELMMPSNHLVLCCPLLLPSVVVATCSGKHTQKNSADSGVQFITLAGLRQSLILVKDPNQHL